MSDENVHALDPVRPVKPPSRQWWRFLQREDWIVVGWVLSIKILLFIFGAKSFRILENKPLPGRFGWLDIWNRWDSLHYLQVAQFGYNAAATTILSAPLLFPAFLLSPRQFCCEESSSSTMTLRPRTGRFGFSSSFRPLITCILRTRKAYFWRWFWARFWLQFRGDGGWLESWVRSPG